MPFFGVLNKADTFAFDSIGNTMRNTGYLVLGVMLSNLIFSPLVLLVKWIAALLKPEITNTRANYA